MVLYMQEVNVVSETLSMVLKDYYKIIKEEHPNYRACYSSFLEYCNEKFPNVSLADISKKITKVEIRYACKKYFESSKKATSIEAIQRYLTAIDQFCKYTRKSGVTWEYLGSGCRNKQMVHDVCISLNEELKQKIYLPFDKVEEIQIVEKELEHLKKTNFYQFGQRVIYKLLIMYGFKEKVIINMKKDALNKEDGTLFVNDNKDYGIHIKLEKSILEKLIQYDELHKHADRIYLFTKSNGTQLTPDSVFATLKERLKKKNITNFTPTTVALHGVSNLIKKGLSIEEIKVLTGFETQKIEDVSKYLLIDENMEELINNKLQI